MSITLYREPESAGTVTRQEAGAADSDRLRVRTRMAASRSESVSCEIGSRTDWSHPSDAGCY
eukprot:246871-Rhodomonas_salina.1